MAGKIKFATATVKEAKGKQPKKARKASSGKKSNAWRAYTGGSSNDPIPF